MNLQLSQDPSTSLSLLSRACHNQSGAWHEFVQLYGPVVYAWIRRMGFQPADASDVMQDTLAAVSVQLGRFDPTGHAATFRGWLWTITRNKAMDFLRRATRQPQAAGGSTMQLLLEQLSGASSANDTTSGAMLYPPTDQPSDQAMVVRRALEILRPRFESHTWDAFWQTMMEGRSIDDVALDLGMNRWSVYKARSRVLNRLREQLAGLEELP